MACLSKLSGPLGAGVVTKVGYTYTTPSMDLNAYARNGIGFVVKAGIVVWGPDQLSATGQRWPSGV